MIPCYQSASIEPLKRLVKNALRWLVRHERAWTLLNRTVWRTARQADHLRRRYLLEGISPGEEAEISSVQAAVRRAFPDLTVRHGIFEGLKYPRVEAAGSCLFPKLLGSYERELQEFFASVPARRYGRVVDIGCAEGYYAVGLARLLPGASVCAFDTDERSRELCREMAELNGVADRLEIRGWCDEFILRALPRGEKTLIISDCEGYEAQLFSADCAAALARHDLLIETHDFINPDISIRLRQRFAATHDVRTVLSIDDVEKASRYDYPELSGCDSAQRLALLAEFRPATMRWLILTGKS
ncbi:MAG: methyltransferase [Verrucomicrobiales bacterium]|nr:methyltransferase [Verrucomicrobiales bacterium]